MDQSVAQRQLEQLTCMLLLELKHLSSARPSSGEVECSARPDSSARPWVESEAVRVRAAGASEAQEAASAQRA